MANNITFAGGNNIIFASADDNAGSNLAGNTGNLEQDNQHLPNPDNGQHDDGVVVEPELSITEITQKDTKPTEDDVTSDDEDDSSCQGKHDEKKEKLGDPVPAVFIHTVSLSNDVKEIDLATSDPKDIAAYMTSIKTTHYKCMAVPTMLNSYQMKLPDGCKSRGYMSRINAPIAMHFPDTNESVVAETEYDWGALPDIPVELRTSRILTTISGGTSASAS